MEKKKVKLFLFTVDIILYIRNPLEIIITDKQVQQGYRTQDHYLKNQFYFYTPVQNNTDESKHLSKSEIGQSQKDKYCMIPFK